MADKIPASIKKEISRLRSDVRKLTQTKKEIAPFTGVVSGNYWTQTGMPWVNSEGRKAVLTEYFWQPIRGQPRRVDTNELRQFSQTFWVSSCVKTIMDEVASLEWDIVPKEGFEYSWVEEQITETKDFFRTPNHNKESFSSIIKAYLKDILEIDAGAIVKVFDIQSYDFNVLEPKSGAPTLKPLGQRRMTEIYARDGASFLKEIDKFGFLLGFWQYSYQIPAHPMWFSKDEISYCSEHPRSMSPYGYARTQAILDVIKSLHYSTLYNKKFFEETPIPDGALSLLDTNETEMQDFRNYWNNEFRAQPHKVAVMNKDIKWTPFNITQRELEFLETQKWYYNIVISAFGLTPAEMGITDDLNRATSATQAELVKRKGIRPFLKLIENQINADIIPEFGFEGIEFQFIYDDPAEKKARLENWQMELNMGVKTINEVRLEMGLEPIEGGDISTNMTSQLMGNNNQNPKNEGDSNANQEEDREARGYSETRQREEGKNGTEKKETESKEPEKKEKSLVANNLKKNKYISMSRDELIREHQKLVDILESGTDEERKKEAEKQKEELEEYMHEGTQKGVDDGQYYRDQTFKPAQNYYQPQNKVQFTALPFTPTSQPPEYTDTTPSNLGSSYQQVTQPSHKEDGKTHCPICGSVDMVQISASETGIEDTRCGNCGARFFLRDLQNAPLMEEIANTLMANNMNVPLDPPMWNPKSFNKQLDLDMDVKEYTGIDTSKAYGKASAYAQSQAYKKLLRSYLDDISTKDREKIIAILKNGMKSGASIRDLAKQINGVIDDRSRSELIARTETVRLANEGNLLQMEEKGVEKVKYISAPEDGRLCPECKKHNNQIMPLQKSKGMLPIHPNCRCLFTEVYD